MSKVRADKWLWSVRLFKTRTLAKTAIEQGKVRIRGQRIKPSRDVLINDVIRVQVGWDEREITVLGLIEKRVSAAIAQTLYEESEESIARREKAAELRKLNRGADILMDHKPNKKERRKIHRFKRIGADNDN
ncbi:MAG: RNA-binding protein [Gammaproteobacteria bacterium]|nr:RNA-binding protein [Gammaproteobacteria bacterium]